MTAPTCQACSRAMRDRGDFPRGNFSSEFCSDCVDECGRLKPRQMIRENMILRRIKNGSLTEEEATEIVDNLIGNLPAWKNTKSHSF